VIRVVAARAAELVEAGSTVVARTARVGSFLAPEVKLVHAYDAELDGFSIASLSHIASDLNERGRAADITYVVPGLGSPGDATVALIEADLLGCVVPAALERGLFGSVDCRVVDAAQLAMSTFDAPFERGGVSIDPLVPLVVTNWYGDGVVVRALSVLEKAFGDVSHLEPTSDAELLVPPLERLTPMASLGELEHVVARLRRPDGCPWDRQQTRESLYPQFTQELEELGAAIASGDFANQQEELGDVLFHVVAQCQLAHESGEFSLDDVIREITAKLVRRHPHVFGDEVVESIDDVLNTWNRVKAEEKSAR
jgi:tetrapyrrole methylase family protein / MazG family protein